MKCFEAESYFLDFLSNELASEQRKDVLVHLAQCALCHKFYTEIKKTEELVSSLQEDLTPTSLLRKTDKKLFQKKSFNFKIVNIAAGFIFIISVGFFIYTQKKQSDLSLSPVVSSIPSRVIPNAQVENVSYRPGVMRTSWAQNTFQNFLNSTTNEKEQENIQTEWHSAQPLTLQVGQKIILPSNRAYLIEITNISKESVQAIIKTER